ncbi:MAG TPA: acetate uptake transporter [Bacteroidales bacterium]|nr:acetate uptake transporter [Bacteroidales bacterium]HPS18495.1 acetate uptake transporter [Bacteroidales bacterium]
MENQNLILRDNTANPAPLGLTGFALTTILLNLHNAGYFALGSTILAMGITIGGIAQVIVGIMEWKKNNTFGTTAFAAYGFFWLSLVFVIILPKMGYGSAADKNEMASYLAVWGIFTIFLFIGTFRISVALQLLFGTLALLFFLLAIGDATESTVLKTFAGYEGIICGLIALYSAMGQVLNEMFGKTVMPLGIVKKK